jgi:hypothetical protein
MMIFSEDIEKDTLNMINDFLSEEGNSSTKTEIKIDDIWNVVIVNKNETKGIFTTSHILKGVFLKENPLCSQLTPQSRISVNGEKMYFIYCDYVSEIKDSLPVFLGVETWSEKHLHYGMNLFLHYIGSDKFITGSFLKKLKQYTQVEYFGILSQFEQVVLYLNYKTAGMSYRDEFLNELVYSILKTDNKSDCDYTKISNSLSKGGDLTKNICEYMSSKLKKSNEFFHKRISECLKNIIQEHECNKEEISEKKYHTVPLFVELIHFATHQRKGYIRGLRIAICGKS